jgi:ABC-type dipeptide/oligopeptide/nickel transport system permease subunit
MASSQAAARVDDRRRIGHRRGLRWRRPNWTVLFSLAVLAGATVLAAWPRSVTSLDPTSQHLADIHKPPGYVDGSDARHPLGTDHLGRDELSRLVYGARASLAIAYAGLALGVAFGVAAGLLGAYVGGWVDAALVGIVDLYLSFPYILIAIVWASFVPQTAVSLVVIVAVRGWVEFARVVRADVLSKKEREYVTAARSLGAGETRIVARHILPHIAGPVLVLSGFQLGSLILLEATLSFLGTGIRPPTPSWGSMLAEARGYIAQAWWTAAAPSVAVSLVILATNLLGDGLRDLLDPGAQPVRR